jgi:hypothetical protein
MIDLSRWNRQIFRNVVVMQPKPHTVDKPEDQEISNGIPCVKSGLFSQPIYNFSTRTSRLNIIYVWNNTYLFSHLIVNLAEDLLITPLAI